MKNGALFLGSGVLACLCYALLLSLLLLHIQNSRAIPAVLQSMDVNFLIEPPSLPPKIPLEHHIPHPAPIPKLPKQTPRQAPKQNLDQNPFKQNLGVQGMFSSIQESKKVVPAPTLPPAISKEQVQQMQQAKELLQGIKFGQHQQVFKDLQSSLNSFKEHLQTIKNKNIDFQVPQRENISKQEFKSWFHQIYKILDSKWHLQFYQKTSVSAIINISETGQLSFSIVQPSPFLDFNQQIQALLTSLQSQKFPPYPGKRAITLKVNFKTKDQWCGFCGLCWCVAILCLPLMRT